MPAPVSRTRNWRLTVDLLVTWPLAGPISSTSGASPSTMRLMEPETPATVTVRVSPSRAGMTAALRSSVQLSSPTRCRRSCQCRLVDVRPELHCPQAVCGADVSRGHVRDVTGAVVRLNGVFLVPDEGNTLVDRGAAVVRRTGRREVRSRAGAAAGVPDRRDRDTTTQTGQPSLSSTVLDPLWRACRIVILQAGRPRGFKVVGVQVPWR